MLFNSLTFLFFFALVYFLYWTIPTSSGKKWLLLIASYLFYAAWSPPYIGLLLFSTTLDWWLARLVDGTEDKVRRRQLLFLSLLCNLCLLGYFKYGNFLVENFVALLSSIGMEYHPLSSNIVLPIGISFYTFASLSYTIEVYRRNVKADCRFLDYALFVSFFPHLVAGPIVRASYLLPQISNPRKPTIDQIGWGLALLVMGLFAKVVLADGVFAPVVDRFYAQPSNFGMLDAWTAVLSFSGQIYYDFGGYSLCAIGIALCFGFAFPDNFRHPYAARGFSDFWRRWHISLSTWLRDHLYIPLGGSRHGPLRTYVALMLTMLIGGLWHGASWMFVLWGFLHALYLSVEWALRKYSSKGTADLGPYRLVEFFVFLVITLTWIPFRASSASEVSAVAISLVGNGQDSSPMPHYQDLTALLAVFLTICWHIALRDRKLETVLARLGTVAQGAMITFCLIGLYLFSGGDQRAFLYFQF